MSTSGSRRSDRTATSSRPTCQRQPSSLARSAAQTADSRAPASRGRHQTGRTCLACRWNLAPGLDQRGRVAPGHDPGHRTNGNESLPCRGPGVRGYRTSARGGTLGEVPRPGERDASDPGRGHVYKAGRLIEPPSAVSPNPPGRVPWDAAGLPIAAAALDDARPPRPRSRAAIDTRPWKVYGRGRCRDGSARTPPAGGRSSCDDESVY
jgi:hypothetical protein